MSVYRLRVALTSAVLLAPVVFMGCSDDETQATAASTQATATSQGVGGSGGAGAAGGMGGAGGDSGGGGFSPTTTGTGGGGGRCGTTLMATIRDFKVEHEDFETYINSVVTLGLVQPLLGNDNKPLFQSDGGMMQQITNAMTFAQWYNDVSGTNQALQVELQLVESSPGLYSYINNEFFPVDGMGWGNEGNPHNFHFTTEIHTQFEYAGGEVFTFNGDDDLWVFINGRLAIDLGGLHPSVEGNVILDDAAAQLEIVPGNVYSMDLFHAERHTTQSNFRIDTTISCFVPPPQ